MLEPVQKGKRRLAQSALGSKVCYGAHHASHEIKSFGHCKRHIRHPYAITSMPHSGSATAVKGSKDDTSEAANVQSFLRKLLSDFTEHVSAHLN
jgi:hypothetical protein